VRVEMESDAEMKVGSSEGMKGRKKRWGVGSEKGR
jgi:hypothetical protein